MLLKLYALNKTKFQFRLWDCLLLLSDWVAGRCLQLSSWFPAHLTAAPLSHPAVVTVTARLAHHIQACSCNAYEVNELIRRGFSVVDCESVELGGAVYPTIRYDRHKRSNVFKKFVFLSFCCTVTPACLTTRARRTPPARTAGPGAWCAPPGPSSPRSGCGTTTAISTTRRSGSTGGGCCSPSTSSPATVLPARTTGLHTMSVKTSEKVSHILGFQELARREPEFYCIHCKHLLGDSLTRVSKTTLTTNMSKELCCNMRDWSRLAGAQYQDAGALCHACKCIFWYCILAGTNLHLSQFDKMFEPSKAGPSWEYSALFTLGDISIFSARALNLFVLLIHGSCNAMVLTVNVYKGLLLCRLRNARGARRI